MGNHLLEIDGLQTVFATVDGVATAVDDVSFSMEKGETLGIVGESGCGKTIVGMAVLNLVKATTGKIIFRGADISDRSVLSGAERLALRKEMQIIFQDPYSSLNPRSPLNQILDVPMRIQGLYTKNERKDRIAYLLDKVGLLPEQGSRYPHEFSGGQRQRIGIARALSLYTGPAFSHSRSRSQN